MKIYCEECGKEIKPGNRSDGLPNGLGFITKAGGLINICADCVIEKGKEHKVKGNNKL